MKIKKSFLLVLVSVLFFLLSSCASNTMRVPGETRIILKNLAVEYNNIGDGYMALKNYTKAAEYYEKAMRDSELYLSVYYKLARAYALGKNYGKAIESYSYLLSLDGDNSTLKSSLAYVYAMKGDYDESIRRYKILIEENPYNQAFLENYTGLLINTGHAEEAESYYYIIKEKFPDSSQLSEFAQKLSDLLDNFNPDENPADIKSGSDKTEKTASSEDNQTSTSEDKN